jgi:hypothetical protein
MVPGKGKGLVLLRMCNELLRRLSKETNTVFCGRILMFLANSFPLGERSGVNLRGDFSTETTRFDDDQEVDADTTLTGKINIYKYYILINIFLNLSLDDQKAFYKLFWSIRIYFVNPPSVFQDENFTQLQQGTNAIVERLQLIAQKEADLLGARRSEMADAGLKRKKTDDLDIMDQDPNLTEQMLNEINHQFQFPRLLSSRKLLDLEMEDARFRRNIIVQYLILFLYLSGFSQEEKDKTQDLLAARGATKQSLVQPTYILSDDQIKWIKDNQDVLLSLLRSTKPHGNLYTEIVLTILEHERHWVIFILGGISFVFSYTLFLDYLEVFWMSYL